MKVVVDILSDLNVISVIARLLLAMVCSGIIGIERGKNGQPAGIRTHMLVCVGSAIVMMTNIYISIQYGNSDPTRMAAQVVSGIGFLGAGTIIVTRDYTVRGLTTAATLWSSACMGLAIGVGFYSGAIIGCIVIWIVTVMLHSFSNKIKKQSAGCDYSVMFYYTADFCNFFNLLKAKDHDPIVYDIDVKHVADKAEITMARIHVSSHIDTDDHEIKDYMYKLNCTSLDDNTF